MDLTISLSPEEAFRLRVRAQKRGVPLAEYVKHLVVEQNPSPPENPTLALFQQWNTEDAAMTDEEVEAEKRLWEEFEQGINQSRRTMGMREL